MSKFEDWKSATRGIEVLFMEPAAATWDALLMFQRELSIVGGMAEIGVYKGGSASLLALHLAKGEHLTLVDMWSFGGYELARSLSPEEQTFLQGRSSDLIGSPSAAKLARSCRWVHIDGEHSGEAVSMDLALADQWLKQDGIICIDDFFNEMYPQIAAAVFSYLASHRFHLSLFLCGHNKGYLCRPTVAPTYLEFVAKRLSDEFRSRGITDTTICKTNGTGDINCFGVKHRIRNLDYYGLDEAPATIRY